MYPLMYRRNARTCYCAGIIVFAMLLRLALAPGLGRNLRAWGSAVLGSDALFQTVLFLETGVAHPLPVTPAEGAPDASGEVRRPSERSASPQTAPLSEPDPSQGAALSPETEPPADEVFSPREADIAPFTAGEAEAISLRGNCTYTVDKTALLLSPLEWSLQPGPKILILHSHSCESYTPSEGYAYVASGNYRTLELSRNVVAVGDALAEELGRRGVECIHDRTLNDYPDYNRSYANARQKIADYLSQYPSIVMVVDLHRDALEDPVRETAELNGTVCAPLMLVVGTNEGGLDHPHWQRNLSCALKLQALANRAQPGLFKALSFRKERFNGDMTGGSVIVEVGSTENTLPEAIASMPYLAEDLAALLQVP